MDYSIFAQEDELVDSTPGLTINTAIEVESIEDISKIKEGVEKIKEAAEETDENKEKTRKKVEPEQETEESDVEEQEQETEEPEDKPEKTSKSGKEEVKEEVDGESPLKVFAEFLGEKGIIEFDPEKFEDNEDYLIDKIKEQIDGGIEEYKNSFNDKAKELIEALEAGIPAEAILERNAAIDTYENLDDKDIDDNEALQKNLIRNLYTMKGYDKAIIDKKLRRFEDTGILAEEAKDAKVELIDIVKRQKEDLKQNQAQELKKQEDNFKNWKVNIKKTLDEKDEIVPGLKMTEAQKKAVFNGLTVVDKDGKNELRKLIEKDPMFDLKVAYIALALKWDFSSFDRKAMSSATKKLRDVIEGSNKMGGGLGGGSRSEKASSGVDFSVIKKALK